MAYDKTTVWDGGGGDNNWSTADNWDNGVPGSDSLAQFDATSIKDCTIDGSKPCGALDVQAGYSGGTISLGASALTVSGDSGSALAHVTIAANADMFDAGTGTVDITGTGNISNPGTTNAFYNLTQTGAVTTTATGDVYIDNVFTTSNTGTVTDDGGGTRDVHILGSLVVGGVTWLSVSTLALWFGIGTTIPGDDYGNINIRVRLAATGTVTMGGDVTTSNGIVVGATINNDTNTLASGGFNLSCADIHLGISGQPARGGTLSLTGSSILTVTGEMHVYADDGTEINGIVVAASGVNAISCSGDWTIDTGGNFDAQDSTVTFDGSGAQAITSGGQAFANVIVDKSGGTATLQDAMDCSTFTYTGASFNDGGFVVTVSGDVSITPVGTFTMDGTWTQTGDANFQIFAGGTQNTTPSSIVLQGTGTAVLNRHTNLTCAAAGKVTTVATRAWRIDGVLTLGTGTLTNNREVITNPANFVLAPGYTWNGTGAIQHQVVASGTYPALTTTNSVSIRSFRDLGYILQLGGVLSVGGLEIRVSGAGDDLIFTTNDFAITCLAFTWGTPLNGVEDITLNMGASVVSCTSYCEPGLNGTATQTINMGTSQWTCTGAWTFQSNHTIVPGTSSVEFNGTVAQAVTSNGKQFYDIEPTNSHASGVTFADAMNSQGTLTFNSTATAVRVDFDETGAHVWTNVAQAGGNAVTLRSEVDTNASDVTLANPATLSQIDVKDSNLSGADIDVTDPSNTDSGNNSANWLFAEIAAQSGDHAIARGVARGVMVGVG